MRLKLRRKRPSTWKGALAGLVGGLVASWTMNEFQALLSKASEKLSCDGSKASSEQLRSGQESKQQKNPSEAESEDATMKTADKLSESLLGTKLSKEQKKKAGPVIHYLFGAATGGVYGALAEHIPALTVAEGIPFGTAVFLGADEIAVPALGFSRPPQDYPLSVHASALASHLVYGATTEIVRKLIRRELDKI